MQGGHWCRRKCDVPSSLCKILPQLVKENWNVQDYKNELPSLELTMGPTFLNSVLYTYPSPGRMRIQRKFIKWILLSMLPIY